MFCILVCVLVCILICIHWEVQGGHTVANQQTLTSYLTPGNKSSSRNHDSSPAPSPPPALGPCTVDSTGNDAFNPVRRSGFSGPNVSRPRSSSAGGCAGGGGATKIVFSTLATATSTRVARVRQVNRISRAPSFIAACLPSLSVRVNHLLALQRTEVEVNHPTIVCSHDWSRDPRRPGGHGEPRANHRRALVTVPSDTSTVLTVVQDPGVWMSRTMATGAISGKGDVRIENGIDRINEDYLIPPPPSLADCLCCR